MKMTKRILSFCLAIVMLLGTCTLTIFAGGDSITYLYPEYNKTDGTFYENCSSGIKEWKEGECEDYTLVTESDITWGESGKTKWYVAMDQIDITNTVTIQGDVRLILCDGASLTITGTTGAGIDNYGEGNSFTVYAESESSVLGKLIVTGYIGSNTQRYAGIRSAGGATMTINGGDVTAYGASDTYAGAGIGGNAIEDGSNITVNGGKVTVDNDGENSTAAGIGGGSDGNGEYITINGGTVIAGNEKSYGAGIGGGEADPTATLHNGGASYITINGGNVTAKSKNGAGIGSGENGYTASYITITGGTVDAFGVVGIGGSANRVYGANFISAHDIVISGGTVNASTNSGAGAAIGGRGSSEPNYDESPDEDGSYPSKALPAKVYNITISGSGTTVTAKASTRAAGIGGGLFCSAENITIKDGATVIANGGKYAAGIGGGGNAEATNAAVGAFSNADNITISGEGTTVIATSGGYGAGIGAGQYGIASNITITEGAKVYATTVDGCAIGAGLYGSAEGITISDGAEVVAVASGVDAAIGARYNASNITIDNAKVTAKSGQYGTAIGSAKGKANNIVIKGEDTVVTAISSEGAIDSGSAIGAGEEGSATGIYVDASLLMVQNDDEILTDDMEICKDRTIAEDVSATVCNKYMHVIVIKPRDAYVAQVGSGENVTKYYFVQTAIDKTIEELSYLSKRGNSYYIDETASANFSDGDSIKLDDISITMIADSSEKVDIGSKTAYIYDEYDYAFGMKAYLCQNITIDLNGHVLSAFFDCGASAVTIGEKQTLTLIDSNPTTEHKFTVDDNGLYCWDEAFTSQVLSRLKTDEDGNYFWDDDAAIVTIKGGCITGVTKSQFENWNTYIFGVYNKGTFNMLAGAIIGNSGKDGGGVHNEGTMTVGGTAVVEGNIDCNTGVAQNVYLASGKKIIIDNLKDGANIGITTATKPTEGSPVSFTTNGTKSDEAYFFSDSLDYADKYYNEGTCLDLILGYRVTTNTCENGTISVGNQKSAYEGETVYVTITPNSGYELDTLSFSGDGIIATDIKTAKSFEMPAKEVVVAATFTKASEENSDVTIVKLEWTINDIAVTYTSHKTWDPNNLKWVESKEDIAASKTNAIFNITNYSSKAIIANVKFEVEESLKDTFDKATFTNNDCVVNTPITKGNNNYQESDFTALKQTITAGLTFNKDNFAGLTATTSATKYGTYTVTISAVSTKQDASVTAPSAKTGLTYSNLELELVNAGITDGGEWQYKLNDGEYSTSVPKAKNAGTYTVCYKLVGDENYNDIAEASVQVTIAKKNATITTTGVTKEYTYTGSEQTINSGATVDSGATLTYTNNTFTDRPSSGKQTVTISATETANYNAASTTVEITINKATQTVPKLETTAEEDYGITLKAIAAGHGATLYGISETDDVNAVTKWQNEIMFTGLDENTEYYFFAKYEGDKNYEEATSQNGLLASTSGCFVAGTKISMADGTFKNIEDIVVGDSVKSYDVVKGEFYTTTINKVWTSSNTTISTITLTDGTQIQCTPNHPICTTDGFKSVNPNFIGGLKEYPSTTLNIGDMVVTDHGTFAVSSIETNVGESVDVYNLSVVSNGNELNNTFVANGVVAHNKAG